MLKGVLGSKVLREQCFGTLRPHVRCTLDVEGYKDSLGAHTTGIFHLLWTLAEGLWPYALRISRGFQSGVCENSRRMIRCTQPHAPKQKLKGGVNSFPLSIWMFWGICLGHAKTFSKTEGLQS